MARQFLQQNPSGAYVYAILVDGVVRYIGKGRGHRYKFHERAAKRVKLDMAAGKNPRSYKFHRRLMEAMDAGAVISHAIVRDQMDDRAAFELEAETVAGYPAGQLWNEAPGGLGFDISDKGLEALRQKTRCDGVGSIQQAERSPAKALPRAGQTMKPESGIATFCVSRGEMKNSERAIAKGLKSGSGLRKK